MFFMTKKKKIREYLDDKPKEKYTAFDLLLSDYLDGSLKNRVFALGLRSNEINVTWDDDIQFISVDSTYRGYWMDLVIYTDEIVISFSSQEHPDENEPEACKEQSLPLESKDQIFDLIKEKIAGLE